MNCSNLFLLERPKDAGFTLNGPNGFRIEVKSDTYKLMGNKIRVDIVYRQMDIDIYYFITNELDWMATNHFIIDLCQGVYDASVKLREAILSVPTKIYGLENPDFTKTYKRDKLLNDLGI